MKILLTGANGFVGARIRAAAPVICAPSLRGAEKEDIGQVIRYLLDEGELKMQDGMLHISK